MTNLVISIKSSDVMMCVHAHELLAGKTPYPLHVGITESGTVLSGNIKSAIGLGLILNQGIGDTIRVSLTGDVVEEIKSAAADFADAGTAQKAVLRLSAVRPADARRSTRSASRIR